MFSRFPDLIEPSTTIAFMLYTSGTSSTIKEVCKTHKQTILNFNAMHEQSLNSSDVIFFNTTISSITNIHEILCSIFAGVKRVFLREIVGCEKFMDIVDKYKVTIIFFAPVLLNKFKSSKSFRPFTSVKSCLTGAMRITTEFIEEVRRIFPSAKIVCLYACTEGEAISFIRKDTKSWSSGQVTNGYKVKVIFYKFYALIN